MTNPLRKLQVTFLCTQYAYTIIEQYLKPVHNFLYFYLKLIIKPKLKQLHMNITIVQNGGSNFVTMTLSLYSTNSML